MFCSYFRIEYVSWLGQLRAERLLINGVIYLAVLIVVVFWCLGDIVWSDENAKPEKNVSQEVIQLNENNEHRKTTSLSAPNNSNSDKTTLPPHWCQPLSDIMDICFQISLQQNHKSSRTRIIKNLSARA